MADREAVREKDDRRLKDDSKEAAYRAQRRQLIRSAVAAIPVVLTVGAGTASAVSY